MVALLGIIVCGSNITGLGGRRIEVVSSSIARR
jgi:hypothetical protein